MSDHSVFTDLALHAKSGGASDEPGEQSQFERGTHRTIPAAGAPSVLAPGAVRSAFDHPYIPGAGSTSGTADAGAAAQRKTRQEKRSMATTTTAPVKAVRNIQLRICRAIEAAGGTLMRADLAKKLSDLDVKQLSQGLFQVSASSRVLKNMTDAGFSLKLTRSGKEFVKSNAEGVEPPAATKRARKPKAIAPAKARAAAKKRAKPVRKKPKTRRAAVRVHQTFAVATPTDARSAVQLAAAPAAVTVVQERSFRCAVISDGGFFLHKGDQQIDLTAAEHREMLNYIDRVRGVDAPETARS